MKLSSPEHVENEHFEERHSKIQNGTLPLAPAYYKCKWASLQIIMQNSNDRQKLKKDAYANKNLILANNPAKSRLCAKKWGKISVGTLNSI